MTAEQRRRELPKAIMKWYKIEQGSNVACIVAEEGNSSLIAEALEEDGRQVSRLAFAALESGQAEKRMGDSPYGKCQYDIIVAVDIIEYASDAAALLSCIRGLLKPEGKLLLAADNRLGIRYFCGDQDYFSGKNYDSIENYRHLLGWERESMKGRAYSKSELTVLLEQAGFLQHRFFSVFPRCANPQLLLAEDYMPNEALDIRVFPEYNNPDTVFLMEEELYPSLMENGLLHGMANGFFVECPCQGECTGIWQVTLSAERGLQNAMATIIRKDGFVEKRALYQEGNKKLRQLLEHNEDLMLHHVRMIDAVVEDGAFVMPYMAGIPANEHFRDLLQRDKDAFLTELDAFWHIILHSSEAADLNEINWEQFEPGWEKRKKDDPNRYKWKQIASGTAQEREELGVILKRGYLDLVSLNCFYADHSFVFYDQELYLENVPAKAVMLRTIEFIYKFNDQLDEILPRRALFERYGMLEHMGLYQKFISHFLNILRENDGLSDYFKEGRREYGTVQENRRRMNYSEEEYKMIFKDVFHHTKGRRLYLFGSGKYARQFREKYDAVYPVSGYLDNDESRWGMEVDGLPVLAPRALLKMNPAEYKVIICIRNYLPVVKQLHRAGIPNYSVYDPRASYPDDRQTAVETDQSEQKKYNVGYIAGVFDLFHIGHLNLLMRAKAQCSHLIVGVVTDEGVIRHKKSRPQIPFDERIAIVRACRYVDEAVEIPLDQGDTDEAYRRYHFDVQFSGSDYAGDPKWMAKKAFLQRNGADLVFFPYTEGISTTQLKDRVNNGQKVVSLDELMKILRSAQHVKLYGAGLRLASFMEGMAACKMSFHAECILVSSNKGNPKQVYGLPVVEVSKADFHDDDVILLTMSDCFVDDARELLAVYGMAGKVYELDYTMIDRIPYRMIYQSAESFIKDYPKQAVNLNCPVKTENRYVWSCWWQGEENAPELVRKCLESQRRSIPKGSEHVLITWDNYKEYIELPDYIVKKAEDGRLIPAHLADITRCCLLYKYGGIWLDATVYMTDCIPEEYFAYELLTRSTGEKIYCTNTSWVTWFLGGRKGAELYHFVMETFFYCLREYDKVPHYYMIDFLIAIACRELEGVENALRKIPVNNKNATELQKHLQEPYIEEAYNNYIQGGVLQKLTYKGTGYNADSIYQHLIRNCKEIT